MIWVLLLLGWVGASALTLLAWIGLCLLGEHRTTKRQQAADNAELHQIAEYIRHRRHVAAILTRWAQEYGR